MKHHFLIYLLSLSLFLLTSCDGNDSTNPASSSDTGTVALYFADGPTDDYDHIWIWVDTVSIIPSSDEKPVNLFESSQPGGYKIDLLKLKDNDFLLTVNDTIPAGEYCKIRLKILDVNPEGGMGPCSAFDVKLPSGKIDLIPKNPFSIVAGETVMIRLDIDADKSINLHTAGNSGACIFRPVVFVDIKSGTVPSDDCPQHQTGIISELTYDIDDGTVMSFILDLGDGRGKLDVMLISTTSIFDSDGQLIQTRPFKIGQTVFVRGLLNLDKQFEASVVTLGGVETFKGVVKESDIDEIVIVLSDGSGELTVSISDDTVIRQYCNDTFEESTIPIGTKVKASGKFVTGDKTNKFQAVVILFKIQITETMLTEIKDAPEGDGYHLLIQGSGGESTIYFLPEDAIVKLEGDGPIDIDHLAYLVGCQSRAVTFEVNDDSLDLPEISKLIVLADELSSNVISKNDENLILLTKDGNIAVNSTATIFKLEDDEQNLIEFEDIQAGYNVKLFGIYACDDDKNDNSFYAYVIFVMPLDDDTEIPMLHTVF